MDEALMEELENLREENQILRDSLVEVRKGDADTAEGGHEDIIKEITDMLGASLDQAKAFLSPGTEKLTAQLSHQLDENPVPLLLAAFGAGYLFSRSLGRK